MRRIPSKLIINKTLLPIKIHYFFYFGAIAPVYPLLPVIASHLGFSSLIIGIVYGIMPLIAVIFKPAVGALADRYKAHRPFLIAFLVLDGASFFVFQWTTPLPTTSSVTLFCNLTTLPIMEICSTWDADFVKRFGRIKGDVGCDVNCRNDSIRTIKFDARIAAASKLCYFIPLKSVNGSLACDQRNICELSFCSNNVVKILAEQPKVKVGDAVHYGSFWLLLFLIMMIKIFLSVDISIADTICFFMLKDKPFNFGYQRLWGSLSYGVTNLIASILVDAFSEESNTNYRPLFYVSLFLFVCGFVNAFFLKWQREEKSKNIVKSLWRKLLEAHILLFLISTLIFGAFTQITWVYILVYVEEVAASSDSFHDNDWLTTLKGLVILISCFAEVPFFFVSERIISKFGHSHVYTAIMAVWALRFIVYAQLTNPWLFLPVEILNGVTFGLFYATMTTYANAVAPLGAEATVQGTTSAVFEGIGLSIGGFVGGSLSNAWGLRRTFLTMSIVAIVGCVSHAICHLTLVKWAKKKSDDRKKSVNEPSPDR